MAEIKVEPKRSGLGWLWAIIVLVLVGVAAWYFMTQRTASPTAVPADSTRTSMLEIPTQPAGYQLPATTSAIAALEAASNV
jgi:hypothetical protein